MFRLLKILVPVDFSEDSQRALSVARSLALDHGACLILVAAAPPPPATAEPFLPATEYPGLIAGMRRDLEALAADITDLTVETHVLGGSPGPSIVALANDRNADLIVMETHGRSGINRLVMGSVAEYVLRHSPCPVLTMRPGTEHHLQGLQVAPMTTGSQS
ncbi:MAG TPA: universal stress protein [Planctomycetaceae bacterium]|nr:universal stress protein [Planctomycetaceae bacterium]